MKKSELKNIISHIVKEELKRVLPEVLGEMYLRNLLKNEVKSLSENKQKSKKVNLVDSLCDNEDTFEDEDENEIPKVMTNSHQGIYNDSFFSKNEVKHNVNSELLSEKNPWAEMYKDIRLDESSVVRMNDEKQLKNFDLTRASELFKKSLKKSASTKPTSVEDPEAKMKSLQLKRQYLDNKNV